MQLKNNIAQGVYEAKEALSFAQTLLQTLNVTGDMVATLAISKSEKMWSTEKITQKAI